LIVHLKTSSHERAALRDRIQSIETELIALGTTRCTLEEWAGKWDELLTEWFALKDRVGRD
jgi:hypothetical protein